MPNKYIIYCIFFSFAAVDISYERGLCFPMEYDGI